MNEGMRNVNDAQPHTHTPPRIPQKPLLQRHILMTHNVNTAMLRRNGSPVNSTNLPDPKPILADFNAQDLNSIRFSAYRTACKLIYIQKRTALNLLDLVNITEISRQTGLDGYDLAAEVDVGRLRSICRTMYGQLNQRLTSLNNVDVEQCTEWLLYWLLMAYDTSSTGSVRIFSVKVALVVLCKGKLEDKMIYIFGLLSGSDGTASPYLLDNFLHSVLQLPRACGEGPSFSYSPTTYTDCFPTGADQPLLLDAFIDHLLGVEPGPPPIVWLILMHSITEAQTVRHNVHCNSCHRNNFNGFRYKCQQCPNYQSCQECFWKGKVNGRHTLEHEMKETSSTYKSPAKQFGESLRRSFRRRSSSKSPRQRLTTAATTIQQQQHHSLSATASPEPSKRSLAAHLSPLSPPTLAPTSGAMLPMYNGHGGYAGRSPSDYGAHGTYGTLGRQQRRPSGFDTSQSQDDEHILIARYATMLQNHQVGKSGFHSSQPLLVPQQQQQQQQPVMQQQQPKQQAHHHHMTSQPDLSQQSQDGGSKEQIIAELEARNREILREISRMRRDQMSSSQLLLHSTNSLPSPNLLSELKALRQRKSDLESHMNTLQDNRKQLMDKLEIWMKRLKMSQPSSRSTPNGSPRPLVNGGGGHHYPGGGSSYQPHHPSSLQFNNARKYSTLPRMGNRASPTPLTLADRSYQGGSQTRLAELHSAAHFVTDAMTSFNRELNAEDDSQMAHTMSMHGNGGTSSGGRKTVKLHTVPTIYPIHDDCFTNNGYSPDNNLATNSYNSLQG
ncbi:Dystrobrevin alpha [Hypsibius exemplaris]|uniref:Dystrobrevin alpha n=1 Tax=Hypsibius exemplaris TaxID=2072580 RepID=A0A1W0WZU8_HYPEX|nr:Dystrobrevin alpha [Hypsibius exemplaris]